MPLPHSVGEQYYYPHFAACQLKGVTDLIYCFAALRELEVDFFAVPLAFEEVAFVAVFLADERLVRAVFLEVTGVSPLTGG